MVWEELKESLISIGLEADTYKDVMRQLGGMLTEQGYEYLQINDANALNVNLRKQLEMLNDYKFTDSEWERFFYNNIANNNDGIVEKTRKIQEDHIQVLKKDDGTSKNIYLLDCVRF